MMSWVFGGRFDTWGGSCWHAVDSFIIDLDSAVLRKLELRFVEFFYTRNGKGLKLPVHPCINLPSLWLAHQSPAQLLTLELTPTHDSTNSCSGVLLTSTGHHSTLSRLSSMKFDSAPECASGKWISPTLLSSQWILNKSRAPRLSPAINISRLKASRGRFLCNVFLLLPLLDGLRGWRGLKTESFDTLNFNFDCSKRKSQRWYGSQQRIYN